MSNQVPNLAIRARPRGVRRFSRKAIIGGGMLLSTVMFGALAVALQTPSYDDETSGELYNVAHKPIAEGLEFCLLYTSPSPRDATLSRMPSSA